MNIDGSSGHYYTITCDLLTFLISDVVSFVLYCTYTCPPLQAYSPNVSFLCYVVVT